MSEPVAKQRPMLNLDEFERRLRQPAAAPPARDENPLAELARLVRTEPDPYDDVFAAQQERGRVNSRPETAPQARPGAWQQARAAQPPAAPPSFALGGQSRPAIERPQAQVAPRPMAPNPAAPRPTAPRPAAPRNPALSGDFAAIEAGLRGSIQPSPAPVARHEYYPEHYPEPAGGDDYDEDDHWLDQAQAQAPYASHAQQAAMPPAAVTEPARSRRLLYVTAAIIVLGFGGIAGTFAIKRSPASPQEIAMIRAATSPAKIQAPAPAPSPADGANAALQDASVLDKTPQPAPTGVVNREEQPVDLAAQAPAGTSNASSVPVPTPPTVAPPWQTVPQSLPQPAQPMQPAANQHAAAGRQIADAAQGQGGLDGLIESRKVKTLAVRPDGTIAQDDASAAMPSPPNAQPTQTASTAAAPEMPKRPEAAASPAMPSEAEAQPAAEAPSDAALAPTPSRPRAAAHTRPAKLADLDADSGASEPAAAGSEFAVQLAAPATEAEAEHIMGKLARQYGSVIGSHKLKFHHAKVGEKSVYRVRVGGLTKPAAVKLCEALKAKGGSCFIAHD